jgi:hypothetical protein
VIILSSIEKAFDKINANEELIANTKKSVHDELKNGANSYKKGRQSSGYKQKVRIRRISAVAASFAILLCGGIFSMNYYFAEASYIDLDVNPSIELKLNRFDRVIEYRSFNNDGKTLLKEVGIMHKDADEAMKILLSHMNESGYISDDGLVTVTLQSDDGSKETALLKDIESVTKDSLSTLDSNSDLDVYTVGRETRIKARELQMSCGRYVAYSELKKLDPNITPAECKNYSIKHIHDETARHHRRMAGGKNSGNGHKDSGNKSGNHGKSCNGHGGGV